MMLLLSSSYCLERCKCLVCCSVRRLSRLRFKTRSIIPFGCLMKRGISESNGVCCLLGLYCFTCCSCWYCCYWLARHLAHCLSISVSVGDNRFPLSTRSRIPFGFDFVFLFISISVDCFQDSMNDCFLVHQRPRRSRLLGNRT